MNAFYATLMGSIEKGSLESNKMVNIKINRLQEIAIFSNKNKQNVGIYETYDIILSVSEYRIRE